MATRMLELGDAKFQALFVALQQIAHPYGLIISQDEAREQVKVELRNHGQNVWYYIDREQLVQANYTEQKLVSTINLLKERLEKGMIQPDYPDVRTWAKAHLNTHVPYNESIPGWVWPRWNKAHPGMKALIDGGTESIVHPILKSQGARPIVATKRKVVTTKGAVIRDPSKVKKPKCPLHTELAMKFDPLRSVWECSEPGCNIIAQPKQDKEQGRVTLGKGEVHLRVFLQEGVAPTIALISDDNIALDITSMVDWDEVKDAYDLTRVINATKTSGLDTISIPVAYTVSLTAKASIVGAPFYLP